MRRAVRYIVESYDATLSHHGKPVAGTPADPSYKGASLFLYELHLAADPNIVGHYSGQNRAGRETPRRAPYRECAWWVCAGPGEAHWPGDPSRRSTGQPLD